MRELPIPFSDNMVLAIQREHKTQARRLMRPQPTPTPIGWRFVSEDAGFGWSDEPPMDYFAPLCPFGVPGDTLFVQEVFGIAAISFDPPYVQVSYGASGKDIKIPGWHRATEFVSPDLNFQWCEPKRMPRWASRTSLRNESLRVEQLMDITEEDACAEGFGSREAFLKTFRAIYGLDDDANPWVWVIGFKHTEASA